MKRCTTEAWYCIERGALLFFEVIHKISRSCEPKNQWFDFCLSKITRPVATIKSLRFVLFLSFRLIYQSPLYKTSGVRTASLGRIIRKWNASSALRPDHKTVQRLRPANQRRLYIVSHRLVAYTKWSLRDSVRVLHNGCCYCIILSHAHNCKPITNKAEIMDIHNWIMDIHNWITIIQLRISIIELWISIITTNYGYP